MSGGKGSRTGIWIMAAALLAVLWGAAVAAADQVRLSAGLGTPVMLAEKKQTAYLKVGLEGFEMKGGEGRAPVNIALVLDKSGSMSGQKIEKAKDAAILALRKLGRNDIVSVVTYDTTVNVLVPATKLTDRRAVEAAIRGVSASGYTALFSGVSKGAAEVRKFQEEGRVNRIILLSDGLANVGPSSPGELGRLGASLIKEGISVTTIGLGLGYNEDLMLDLATRSEGRHFFAEEAQELARVFEAEFREVLSVVAQEVIVRIRCARGIRPVRVLRLDADITGQEVVVPLNQIYSGQEKRLVLELEVPPTPVGETREIGTIEVTYANMETKTTDRLTSTVSAAFTDREQMVEESIDPGNMRAIVRQKASETYEQAMMLRDAGRIEEAREMLLRNSTDLEEYARRYKDESLQRDSAANSIAARNLDDHLWARQRKQSQEEWSVMY